MKSVLVAACLVMGGSTAHADSAQPFISGGIALGAALHSERDSGFLLGGELSAGRIAGRKASETSTSAVWWVGGYTDVIRDFGSDTTRFSVGPEAGWRFLALDGGVVRELGDDPAWGFTIRPAVTIGVATAFVRYTRFGAERAEASHVEVGLLLKLPYARGVRW